MSLTVRRVVTGHDENGRAIVSIDEVSKNIVQGKHGFLLIYVPAKINNCVPPPDHRT